MRMTQVVIASLLIGWLVGNYAGYRDGVDDVALPAYELGYDDAIKACSKKKGDVNE